MALFFHDLKVVVGEGVVETMSAIEWTEKTWDPVVGCSILSPGCTHCYAMWMAARLARIGTTAPRHAPTVRTVHGNPVWTGELVAAPRSSVIRIYLKHFLGALNNVEYKRL